MALARCKHPRREGQHGAHDVSIRAGRRGDASMTRGAVRCALLLARAAADEWWRPLARAQRLPRSCDAVPLPDAWAGAFERAPDAALPKFARHRTPLRPLGARSSNCSALANRETADLGPFRRAAARRSASSSSAAP